jgi:uncharacterized protein
MIKLKPDYLDILLIFFAIVFIINNSMSKLKTEAFVDMSNIESTEEVILNDQKTSSSLVDIYVDTIIIGAGPAGLAIGHALKTRKKSFVIIELGKKLKKRNRFDPFDIASGIGGAGLFSDGKFSFYPSATCLWKLSRDILTIAYSWYQKLLQEYHVLVPDFPIDHIEIKSNSTDSTISTDQIISITQNKSDTSKNPTITESVKIDKWYLKGYPSIYLSLDNRYVLITKMCEYISENDGNNENIMTDTEFISYRKKNDRYIVKIKNVLTNECKEIECKNIVISAGRMWSMFHQNDTDKFMRFEYGIRIQDTPKAKLFESTVDNLWSTAGNLWSTAGNLWSTDLKDPKYIYDMSKQSDVKYRSTEYRTFCCCRRGEIVKTDCNGIRTCSGRSDCEPTEQNNIGFNVRILDEKLGLKIKKQMRFDKIFENIPILEAIASDVLIPFYGELGNDHLKHGLKLILDKFPDLKSATLSGPTLEGVGSYPMTDENLKMINENIWVIGDACGKFRGITAGMISGYYVGNLL